MKGLLIRVGADQTPGGGQWNAPIDSVTNRFCYVPIPESKPTRPNLETPYSLVEGDIARFGMQLPSHLVGRNMHLDPDFRYLTYGDQGKKGQQLAGAITRDDFLVFYAGLRDQVTNSLIYAIIGFFIVDELICARSQSADQFYTNAHTRRNSPPYVDDVIVIGKAGRSGRLNHGIPIGEYRSRAYRVRSDLLVEWGGISANDGYLQRSAVFPSLLDPERFMNWLCKQAPTLLATNNP